jgi:hypothetical protein
MKSRLNLTIEDSLLKSTRQYAEDHKTSISELAENYFRSITRPVKRKTILDIVEKLDKPPIDPDADLIELYYKDPKHGG